ncbi:DUF4381 family protein [Salmonella enterica]|nr:DUF4381 family protein [Salmonella enterica]
MTTPRPNTFSGTDMPDLAELPLPPAVSLFPQTLAWKVLLIVIILLIVLALVLVYRKYQRRRWRREAMQLAAVAQQNARVDAWFALIKRVTLLHQGPERLRQMSDMALLQQLPSGDTALLNTMAQQHYQREGSLSEENNRQLATAFERWLKALPDV